MSSSKPVELHIELDEKAELHVVPKGTEGAECLDLMAFLEKIPGFTVLESTPNEDMKKKTVQIASKQKVKR